MGPAGAGKSAPLGRDQAALSDDNFATIVFAVEQGRKIYDNLTKYIRFVLVLLVVFVLTFLGATLFNIAVGEPFTPPQVLWIHFVVNAPFGFALGFERESPGLMGRRPRPRGESVLTTAVMITVGPGPRSWTPVSLHPRGVMPATPRRCLTA